MKFVLLLLPQRREDAEERKEKIRLTIDSMVFVPITRGNPACRIDFSFVCASKGAGLSVLSRMHYLLFEEGWATTENSVD